MGLLTSTEGGNGKGMLLSSSKVMTLMWAVRWGGGGTTIEALVFTHVGRWVSGMV